MGWRAELTRVGLGGLAVCYRNQIASLFTKHPFTAVLYHLEKIVLLRVEVFACNRMEAIFF